MKITKKEIQKYNIDRPAEIQRMATVVKTYIVKNNLYVPIAGKNYVMVEGWQFAGGLMGLFPKVVKVENIGNNKWLAQVDIINKKDGNVAGSGFAICSKEENKKKSFEEYAILSMAQTRAIGKAYRNLIGWVMKLAGYEATPSEEMIKIEEVLSLKKEVIPKIEAECHECGNPMNKTEVEYSKKIFRKQLCRSCQADKKKK